MIPMTSPSPDPRPQLSLALDQIQHLVADLAQEQMGLPTPCAEFSVSDLAGHLLTVLRRITAIGEGTDPMAMPHVTPLPDGDLGQAFANQRQKLDESWADDAVLDRVVSLPWRTGPAGLLAMGYIQETTMHAWDLAVALGRRAELDPALATAVLPLARQFVPAEPRGGQVPFGPPVPVADTAEAYEQLAAWLGRSPDFA
jgi:uncharacterized protein (TIGR03086 family)